MITQKYYTEVFRRLSSGEFICENTLDIHKKRLYENLCENEQEYAEYFKRIGFFLDHGNGYFQFCEDPNQPISQKAKKTIQEYIDIVDVLDSWSNGIRAGTVFTKTDFLKAVKGEDNDLCNKVKNLRNVGSGPKEMVTQFIKRLSDDGFIERIDDDAEETYQLTSAYNYIIELFNVARTYNEENIDNESLE